MPINVGALKATTRTILIPYDGDAIKLTYKPSEWTPNTTMQLQERDGAEQTLYSLQLLARLIVDWDLEAPDGGKYPITPDSIEVLNQDVVNAIIDSVAEDMRPKPKTGKR